jgi:hypothetical protein
MFNSKNIFGFIHGLHPHRGAFDNRTFHPVREWMIGLAIAFAIIIGGGVQSALMFVEYRSISTTEMGSVGDSAIKYNRNLVELSIEAYRTKKEEYSKYHKENSAAVVTPHVETPNPDVATSSETVATTTPSTIDIPPAQEESEGEDLPFEEAVIGN